MFLYTSFSIETPGTKAGRNSVIGVDCSRRRGVETIERD